MMIMKYLPNLSNWSLRKKLVFLIMLSSAISMLVSFSVLFGSSLRSSHNESLEQLSGISDILAENSQAALVFGDRDRRRVDTGYQRQYPRYLESQWRGQTGSRRLPGCNQTVAFRNLDEKCRPVSPRGTRQ
jgi:hypothetical protein